ncbi:MAG: hypothetical protein HYY28_03400 [Betaproteobacteria bacterium]|nr:hypothetical protein [Betaproteobacteria bacterium]
MKDLSHSATLLLHLGILAVLAPLALLNHQQAMFNGLDGDYARVLAALQYHWMPAGPALALGPFQGLANVFFPTNFNWVPAFALQRLFGAEAVSPLLSYVLFALELFAASYLAARLAGLSRAAGIAGAWFLVLLALPLARAPRLYAIFGLVPHLVDLLLGLVLVLVALRAAGEGTVARRAAAIALLALLPAFLVAQNPLVVMIIVPAGLAWSGAILLWSESRRQMLWRSGGLLASFAVLLAGGFILFLAGATLYSVPAFFSAELFGGQEILANASIAFQGKPGAHFALAAAAGAALALLRLGGRERRFAALQLALMFAVIIGGWAIVTRARAWRGPQVIYFELALWPFYAAYSGYLAVQLWQWGAALIARFRKPPQWPISQLAGALAAAWALGYGAATKEEPRTRPFPPLKTAVVAELEKRIRLVPGEPFKGYAATFTGLSLQKSSLSWFDLVVFDAKLERATGNDHRFVGLWQYAIPTLQEYSQYQTPPAYLVFSRLLARPADRQIRTLVVLSEPRAHLLQALGVRFIIADSQLPAPARLVLAQGSGSGLTLYLYELPAPNLGNLSPTEVFPAGNASAALAALAKLDLSRTLVAAENLPADLVPATRASFSFAPDGARVQAQSAGRSVLVLPLQFSRCLNADGPSAGGAKIFRANLIQTAILFEGALDLGLRLRVGPFLGAGCRLADLREMRAYGLEAAARAWPIGNRD